MGYKIAELRKQKKMTQAELADASGFFRQTIINLEKSRETTAGTLVKVASALNVTIEKNFCT